MKDTKAPVTDDREKLRETIRRLAAKRPMVILDTPEKVSKWLGDDEY
ncbi:hypothetical protein lacNasYZ03_00360 [Lactobacillus nasalidis]|uniref:Uncharacterized protein n=1 Tax=Lactobacillus nasalidis TaxID=2797258 RepID=A0ABQ3W3W7_9LACO|nr:hypothetical protein [Lactobacillus nasalidis]GHW00017.1 hypothetical protein lacNasYZ02_14460 [Lactobacillus nasalidis]GHW00349.1 hypothetical protein lacNasYZ03_00360 [Lactobacillus nasalidis]